MKTNVERFIEIESHARALLSHLRPVASQSIIRELEAILDECKDVIYDEE